MRILVLGGTRFFGKQLVLSLLRAGHQVSIATRGRTADEFGDRIERIRFDRTDPESMRAAFAGRQFEVVYDMLAYASLDIRHALDTITCRKYIFVSSAAVYENRHENLLEKDFDPLDEPVIWGVRADFPYCEGKRNAERAAFQAYPDKEIVAVRFPVVLGEDDYTGRLRFYVEHVLTSRPMYIDNLDARLSFVRQDEAGIFLSFLCEKNFRGPIHGASRGTISLREILHFISEKSGKTPVLTPDGDPAPYNGEVTHSFDVRLAESLGFRFSELRDWVFSLVDGVSKESTQG